MFGVFQRYNYMARWVDFGDHWSVIPGLGVDRRVAGTLVNPGWQYLVNRETP